MMRWAMLSLIILSITSFCFSNDKNEKWIQPNEENNFEPYWRLKDGIGVSYAPHKGVVRGLLGIQTPYLGHKADRVLNYIAIEPIVDNRRGFSELETSKIDKKQGLKIRSSDSFISDYAINALSDTPTKGIISNKDGVQTLSFYIYLETFENGSKPIIQVILSDAFPKEIRFRIFAAKDSAPFRTCILTATMGNYAQLRKLWLRDEIVTAKNVYADFSEADAGFAPHKQWGADKILKIDGCSVAACVSDIISPEQIEYDKKIPYWWKYEGKTATQYWKSPNATDNLLVRVNARTNYYGSTDMRIPGGVAYENFEFEEPFVSGQEFIFGAIIDNPSKLGFSLSDSVK